jgi:hypothetical protein
MTFFCAETPASSETYTSFINANSYPLLQIPPSGSFDG